MTLSKQTKHYTRTICTLAFTNKHKLGSIWPKSWKLMKTRGPEFGSRQCIKCSCQNTKLARIRTYIRVYEWANGLLSPDLGKYDYWFWPWIWAILELIEVLMIDGKLNVFDSNRDSLSNIAKTWRVTRFRHFYSRKRGTEKLPFYWYYFLVFTLLFRINTSYED